MDDELLSLLGLARKAGKLALGEEAAAEAALGHKARLILLAGDAAENARRRTRHIADTAGAPCALTGYTKAQLGGAVGLKTCAAVTLTDIGLAGAAVKKLAQADPDTYGELAQALTRKAEKNLRRKREKQARQKAARPSKPWAGKVSKT